MYLVLQNTNGSGLSWQLGPLPLIIGRSDGCDIRIYDSAMSRRHTKVWMEGGAVHFEDMGSSNATLINGSPADAGTLKTGDTLGAGSTIFRVTDRAEPKKARATGPNSTPITLSAGLATYLRSPDETQFEPPTHRTVTELHDLFHLGRSLGSLESIAALAALLEQTLREKFDPKALWLAWRYAGDQPLVFQVLDGKPGGEAPPEALLRRAMDSREGVVKPGVHRSGGERHRQTTMAVPLVHADAALGGFALVGRAPGRLYAEDDLHYALGIASIAAPHVRAVRQAEQLRRDNELLQARAGSGARLLGESPAITIARELLARAGNSNLPVLILGETGTGKEIAARMLHDASPRHEGPYVVINCAAIPDNLFESEFFGHEKGAFTGATQKRIGRFEEAHGGTLFLDEVGDLSADNQARILRAIETNTFHRVGGQNPITVDVRIVAATNKTLQPPAFRLDLLHRINGVTIQMPPLRNRPEDLAVLTEHFIRLSSSHGLQRITGLHPKALDALRQHRWPGNVRELKARIDRAILFAQGAELTPDDLQLGEEDSVPESVDVAGINAPVVDSGNTVNTERLLSLAELERQHIQHVLTACEGNIAKAARTLGINRVTLYKRIAEYGGEAE